ncbi:helix-turn-helix transcriptional regulator [Paracoccus onubensis]|uniref:helix-turn-helix transcriptional regulator n=1 Tax=Paracoccus onubensis TaxID=1675788 RepID=UPI002731797A|nr:helix-turn-helix transcriptional regulator [Paracoccus onubensis]MDP0929871.1 helix-turn-helix transcriptional regulator [Paracoccus onubensis]
MGSASVVLQVEPAGLEALGGPPLAIRVEGGARSDVVDDDQPIIPERLGGKVQKRRIAQSHILAGAQADAEGSTAPGPVQTRAQGRVIPGREIVSARLADILLVEAIQTYAANVGPGDMGWLGALLDLRLDRALGVMRQEVAHPRTVAELADVAGMSRSAFSAEFTRRVGQPPLSYLRSWRLTLARTGLKRDIATVANIANAVGYQSQSAFSQAFRRTFGISSKDEANLRGGGDHPYDLPDRKLPRFR